MAWLKIVIGAAFEVGWVIGLSHAHEPLGWVATVICIGASFYLLISSSQKIPVGTAYSVFVGLGAVGATTADFLLFQDPVRPVKIFLILMLLVGVMGLKMVTTQKEES